jgi:regulator of protease activity HflC (stomatin/prohibitin superfamily)
MCVLLAFCPHFVGTNISTNQLQSRRLAMYNISPIEIDEDDHGLISRAVLAVIIIVVLGIVGFFTSFRVVRTGEVGVVRRLGVIQQRTLSEGPHFVVPFLDNVSRESIRLRADEFNASAAGSDMQDIYMTVSVNYIVDPAYVVKLHSTVGRDFGEVVLRPSIPQALKASSGQFTAEQFITRRAEAAEAITASLQREVDRRAPGITIVAVGLSNLDFSDEFEAAIEARQIAEQSVLTARQELEKARVQAEQRVVQAQAEADAMAVLNQEITPELLQRMWLETWNGVMPQFVGNDGSPQVLLPFGGSANHIPQE